MRIKMQDKVKEILIRMNHCRDSDVYLIYEIWKQELAKYNYDISGNDVDQKEYEKQTALKRIREGYYENKFRKSKRKETTRPSQGQPTLCVYGDS